MLAYPLALPIGRWVGSLKLSISRALFCIAVMAPYPPICRDGKDKRNETKADYILVQIG